MGVTPFDSHGSLSSLSVVVVVVFVVCWTPFHAQRLMFAVVTLKEKWGDHYLGYVHHYLFVASGLLMMYWMVKS